MSNDTNLIKMRDALRSTGGVIKNLRGEVVERIPPPSKQTTPPAAPAPPAPPVAQAAASPEPPPLSLRQRVLSHARREHKQMVAEGVCCSLVAHAHTCLHDAELAPLTSAEIASLSEPADA